MSIKRVGILFYREIVQGPRNFIFIWAIVAPVVVSLVVSLVFGSLFFEKPDLGIVDQGESQLVTMAIKLESVNVSEYDTVEGMLAAIQNGSLDMGVVLPEDFDIAVTAGSEVEIKAYISGESLAKNRVILGVTIADLVRDMAGHEAPVSIEMDTLGEEETVPWSDRLLPLVVLMAVFLGGLFLPATSVISEKETRTMQALLVTPATVGEVFAAKGLTGVVLSLVMGIVILLLNHAFGTEPMLLIMLLALGAVMAVEIGLMCGIFLKDVTSLFTVWKLGGILLFAPALVYLFPEIPELIFKVFPTYYLVQPVVEIAQQGARWSDVMTDVLVLMAVDVVLVIALVFQLRRMPRLAP